MKTRQEKTPTTFLTKIVRFFAWIGMTKYTAGSMIYLADQAGHVAIVKPNRTRGLWTFPGGFHRGFEDPAAAARRETVEEIGIDPGPEPTPVTAYRQSWARHIDHLYYAKLEVAKPKLKRRQRFWTIIEIADVSWEDPNDPEFRAKLAQEALVAFEHYRKFLASHRDD